MDFRIYNIHWRVDILRIHNGSRKRIGTEVCELNSGVVFILSPEIK